MRLSTLALVGCVGCAGDLRRDFPFDGELPDGVFVVHEDEPAATVTRVDASNKTAWVYLDLDTREQVSASAAAGQPEWDLAFQRFRIVSNGGVSGSGQTEVAALLDTGFDDVARAPREGYVTDRPDGPDANEDVDSAFLEGDGWYAYDGLAHKLSPRNNVYVVHTDRGRYFKLRLLSYYDDAGAAGHLSFRWAQVQAPLP